MNNEDRISNEQCTMNNVQWKKVKLGEVILDSYAGGTPNRSRDDFFGGEIPWITSGEVNNPVINSTIENITLAGFNNSSTRWIPNNSILVALYGATAGQVSMLKINATSNQAVLAVIPNKEKVDTDYLFYQINFNKENLLFLAQGSGQPNLSKNIVDRLEISIPSLPVQRRIAAILSSADKVIDSTQKVIDKLKQIKQGMMDDLLKPKDGWNKVKLGECCESELGKTLDEGRNIGLYRPYLCALNVLWGKIDLSTIKQMRIDNSELERYLVKKGDLLVCEGGEIGRCAIWEYDDVIYYQNALHRVRFYEDYDARFFMYLLCYYNDLKLIEQYGKGLTIKHLNQTAFRNIPVSIPDLAEQRRIAQILSGIDSKIAAEEKVLEKYKAVKKGLMEKLLNGN